MIKMIVTLLCALPAVLIIGSSAGGRIAAFFCRLHGSERHSSQICTSCRRRTQCFHSVEMDRRARRDQIIRTLHRGPAPGCEKMGTLDGDKYTTGSDLPS